MIITHKLKMNMEEGEVAQRLEMPAGDVSTRSIEMLLYLRQSPWTIPQGVTVLIRYQKPDGTRGEYDTMPDGTAAWSVTDNVLTISVAPQVLTAVGNVALYAEMYLEEKVLRTFAVEIDVKAPFGRSRWVGTTSQDYYYVTNVLRGPVMALPGQLLAVEEVDEFGRVTKVEPMNAADVVDNHGSAVLHIKQSLSAGQKAQARENIGALGFPSKTVVSKNLQNELNLDDFGTTIIEGVVSPYRDISLYPRRDYLDNLDDFDFTLSVVLDGKLYAIDKSVCTVFNNGTGENRVWSVWWKDASVVAVDGPIFEIEQNKNYTYISFDGYTPANWNLKLYKVVTEKVEASVVTAVNGVEPDRNGNVELVMEKEAAVLYEKQQLSGEQKEQARENIGAASAVTFSNRFPNTGYVIVYDGDVRYELRAHLDTLRLHNTSTKKNTILLSKDNLPGIVEDVIAALPIYSGEVEEV